jgi:hypothetical protein
MLDLLLESNSHNATEQNFVTLEIDPENGMYLLIAHCYRVNYGNN